MVISRSTAKTIVAICGLLVAVLGVVAAALSVFGSAREGGGEGRAGPREAVAATPPPPLCRDSLVTLVKGLQVDDFCGTAVSLRLENVASFRGPHSDKGDPQTHNRRLPGAATALARVLPDAPADSLLRLDDAQWQRYVEGLPKDSREQLLRTPFAYVTVVVAAGAARSRSGPLFQDDVLAIPGGSLPATIVVANVEGAKSPETIELHVRRASAQ